MGAPELAAIALVGIGAGVINTLVGGGTSMVLPLLILLGVDPQVANGTNRLCVAFQAAAAAHTLHGKTGVTRRVTLWPVLAVVAGSVPGAMLATVLDPALFRDLLGWILLIGVALFFVRRRRPPARGETDPEAIPSAEESGPEPSPGLLPPVGLAVTFLFGVYGGFVGAGIGVLILLYLPPLLGISMVRMVHVKTWMVFTLSGAAGVWYLAAGLVQLEVAAPLLPSYVVGGVVGAKLALKGGERWIRRAVATVAAVLAIAVLAGWGR